MLRAIDLNDQSMRELRKVQNVTIQRRLPTEVEALAVFETQDVPEFDLLGVMDWRSWRAVFCRRPVLTVSFTSPSGAARHLPREGGG